MSCNVTSFTPIAINISGKHFHIVPDNCRVSYSSTAVVGAQNGRRALVSPMSEILARTYINSRTLQAITVLLRELNRVGFRLLNCAPLFARLLCPGDLGHLGPDNETAGPWAIRAGLADTFSGSRCGCLGYGSGDPRSADDLIEVLRQAKINPSCYGYANGVRH